MLAPMAELSHNPGLGSLAVEALRDYPEFVAGLEADTGMDVGFRSDSLLGLLNANPAPDWTPQTALNLYPRPFGE